MKHIFSGSKSSDGSSFSVIKKQTISTSSSPPSFNKSRTTTPIHTSHTTPGSSLESPLSPELVPIVTLLSSQTHRRYHDGVLLVLQDLKNDGTPASRTWKEFYGVLIGTQLALWDAAELSSTPNSNELKSLASKPTYINFTDAILKPLDPKNDNVVTQNNQQLANILVVSTTLKNRFFLQYSNRESFNQWHAAIRLSLFENVSLQEAYTGAFISSRGSRLGDIKVLLADTKFNYEDWVSVRFGTGMPWKRCYAVISQPSSKKKTGQINFYENDKKIKKSHSMTTVIDAKAIYAVYPSSAKLIDESTIIKLEGTITSGKKEEPQDSNLFIMPEKHNAVPGYDTIIRFLIPTMNAFRLYGRPKRLIANKDDPLSLLFALPTLPCIYYLNVEDLLPLSNSPSSLQWSSYDWRTQIKEILIRKVASGYSGCGSSSTLTNALLSPVLGSAELFDGSGGPILSPTLTQKPSFFNNRSNNNSSERLNITKTRSPIDPQDNKTSNSYLKNGFKTSQETVKNVRNYTPYDIPFTSNPDSNSNKSEQAPSGYQRKDSSPLHQNNKGMGLQINIKQDSDISEPREPSPLGHKTRGIEQEMNSRNNIYEDHEIAIYSPDTRKLEAQNETERALFGNQNDRLSPTEHKNADNKQVLYDNRLNIDVPMIDGSRRSSDHRQYVVPKNVQPKGHHSPSRGNRPMELQNEMDQSTKENKDSSPLKDWKEGKVLQLKDRLEKRNVESGGTFPSNDTPSAKNKGMGLRISINDSNFKKFDDIPRGGNIPGHKTQNSETNNILLDLYDNYANEPFGRTEQQDQEAKENSNENNRVRSAIRDRKSDSADGLLADLNLNMGNTLNTSHNNENDDDDDDDDDADIFDPDYVEQNRMEQPASIYSDSPLKDKTANDYSNHTSSANNTSFPQRYESREEDTYPPINNHQKTYASRQDNPYISRPDKEAREVGNIKLPPANTSTFQTRNSPVNSHHPPPSFTAMENPYRRTPPTEETAQFRENPPQFPSHNNTSHISSPQMLQNSPFNKNMNNGVDRPHYHNRNAPAPSQVQVNQQRMKQPVYGIPQHQMQGMNQGRAANSPNIGQNNNFSNIPPQQAYDRRRPTQPQFQSPYQPQLPHNGRQRPYLGPSGLNPNTGMNTAGRGPPPPTQYNGNFRPAPPAAPGPGTGLTMNTQQNTGVYPPPIQQQGYRPKPTHPPGGGGFSQFMPSSSTKNPYGN
ncbi:Caf120p NDAI_0F04280 [Naumovozyma dairenensis CBS 421]|uniref:PH domain-containing protein n=1 Tax=Naumovozyma dairenensis (strain ATCC 10597 / BCRC 20456 / CBS 421 / NBRC 0211 / NRRL Y-12639) TaxID=1071378 RepID=G0WD85_NAUDC|nr:hypothetical protein NDAI_0F04280 [Naumovozyma dairenensis CBS 421]CCD25746.1 hypothetical protein NDAI_0F04280 [Naumovozyma dairenensis CBS 421]